MNDNVIRFFERYDAEPALRARVAAAEAAYPGSLEIREAVVEAVLLPFARELGLEFTVADLRAYETRLKTACLRDEAAGGEPEEAACYWLLDRGWASDEASFCSSEAHNG